MSEISKPVSIGDYISNISNDVGNRSEYLKAAFSAAIKDKLKYLVDK